MVMTSSPLAFRSCYTASNGADFCPSRKRKLALAIMLLSATGQAVAGPEGGVVTGGGGSINRSENLTTINQNTDLMSIDWQSYNVGIDERVHYIQPDQHSVSLNNILSNNGSVIQGRIDANGHVILVNPNGVFFTETSTINAGGIIASGLSIDSSDFLNGDFTFNALEDTDGMVINAGIINAAMGGNVALIGQQVENSGFISANLGRVNLAAGNEAVVTFDNEGLLGVKITESVLQEDIGVDPAILNSGEITAQDGQILISASASKDIFSGAVNSGSMNHATSVVVNDDGSFALSAGGNVVNSGTLDVSGETGGELVVLGENVTSSGAMLANSSGSKDVAGSIEVHSVTTTELIDGSVTEANSMGTGTGGDIKLLGQNVGLIDEAIVTANGVNGGGQVLIGGDESGWNDQVRNAEFIFLDQESSVSVDAEEYGNGGRLIAFAEDTARFYGELTARGGSESGLGGFIETSGLRGFDIRTTPIVDAADGGGQWLIDPHDITISGTTGDLDDFNLVGDNPRTYTSDGGNDVVSIDELEGFLDGNATNPTGRTVTIRTGAGGTGEGNIRWDASAELTLGGSGAINGTLILEAVNDITFDGSNDDDNTITVPGNDQLNLSLIAGNNINFNTDTEIFLGGGNFYAESMNFTSGDTGGTGSEVVINTEGGDAVIFATGAVNLFDSFITSGGDFNIGGIDDGMGGFTGLFDHDNDAATAGINPSTTTDLTTPGVALALPTVINLNDAGIATNTGSISGGDTTGGGNFTAAGGMLSSGFAESNDNRTITTGGGNIALSITGDISFVNSVIETTDSVGSALGSFTASSTNFNSTSTITFTASGEPASVIDTAGGDIAITAATFADFGTGRLETDGGSLSVLGTSAITAGGTTTSAGTGSLPRAQFDTDGGDFSITGSSFDSSASIVDASSSTGGGNVTINTTGDSTLGRFVIGDDGSTGAGASGSANFDVTARNITISNASPLAIVDGGNNPDDSNVDIFYGNNSADTNIFEVNLTFNASENILLENALILNGVNGQGNDTLNVVFNSNTDTSDDAGMSPVIGSTTISGETNIWLRGGDFQAQGGDFILDASTVAAGNDGFDNLTITTDGGRFVVGGSIEVDDSITAAPLAGNFDSFNANNGGIAQDNAAYILTNNGASGAAGQIYINASGDIELGYIDPSTHNFNGGNENGTDSAFLLDVIAGDDFTLGSPISLDSLLSNLNNNILNFTANNSVNDGVNGINVNADLTASSDQANLSFNGTGNFINTAAINSGGGNIDIFNTGSIDIDANITATGADITVGDVANSFFATSFDSTGGIINVAASGSILMEVAGAVTFGEISSGTLEVDSRNNLITQATTTDITAASTAILDAGSANIELNVDMDTTNNFNVVQLTGA